MGGVLDRSLTILDDVQVLLVIDCAGIFLEGLRERGPLPDKDKSPRLLLVVAGELRIMGLKGRYVCHMRRPTFTTGSVCGNYR
jgi:hypothetical protein